MISLLMLTAFALPPGWLPVNRLDDKPTWKEMKDVQDKVHLYLPPGEKAVRGVFVCYVFHSADPRELARLWRFALVTVPWPFEYDLGHNDKRNGRYKLGHPAGDMGVLLSYLEAAAKETGHPELATAPMVGWLGQNGARLCSDLLKRAPDRVIAWSDSFGNHFAKNADVPRAVPFPFAWEPNKKEDEARAAAVKAAAGKGPTPPADLRCRATTYGFPHGIYGKWNFFMGYLDRCIDLRLPAKGAALRPALLDDGWAGDAAPVGEWNPIAPVKEAKDMAEPVWLPDAYAAWTWRAYHTAKPVVALTGPVTEYKRGGGKGCGLGYGNTAEVGSPLTLTAEAKGDFTKVEFHDGDRVVGTASAAPWKVDGVKLGRGLHALFPVGVRADGSRTCGRPAYLVVE